MYSNEYRLPNLSDVDPDELFECPFDKAHRISAKRFPYHIKKCQKNHLTAKVKPCPFNARHIIQLSEFRHHVANCPDRSAIEPDMAYAEAQSDSDGTYMKGDTSVPSYHHDSFPMSTENWDLEETPHERFEEQAEPERNHRVARFEDNDEQGESSRPKKEEIRLPKQLPKAGGHVQLQHNAMQGRSIAANIFSMQITPQQPTQETKSGQTPSMTTPSPSVVIPTANTIPQNESCRTHASAPVPNLAGLGRGLGIPRGGYRPGLGMPAAGSYPTVKQ